MPFPFVLYENFENGNAGTFDGAGSDDLGRIDFPDHRDDLDIQPWRGGHVMRIDLNRGITTAYIRNNTALSIGTNGEQRHIRFYLRTSPDFRSPDFVGSNIRILTVYSAAGEEFSIGISSAETKVWGPRLAIYTPDDQEFIDGLAFTRDTWLPIQVIVQYSTTNGRVYLQLGDNMVQATRLIFQPFTSCILGSVTQHQQIRGTLYIDDFLVDTQKLEEPIFLTQDQLWGTSQIYIKSSYAFVGPGRIRGATLIGGGSDNEAYLYDADRIPLAHHDIKMALKVSSAESKDTVVQDIEFKRGCYVVMKGANPQVIVHYGQPMAPLPVE